MPITRRSRSLTTAVAVVLVVITSLATTAVANHISDVPSSNPFHDQIREFTDAGCATGFPDGTFKPGDNVRRQQMARFVVNCAGRAAHDQGSTTLTDASPSASNVADVDVTTGAQGAGTKGIVIVEVDASLATNAAGNPNCQCDGTITIRRNGSIADFRQWSVPQADLFVGNASFSEIFHVDTGQTNNFRVDVARSSGSANVTVIADIVATYHPFEGDGTAVD